MSDPTYTFIPDPTVVVSCVDKTYTSRGSGVRGSGIPGYQRKPHSKRSNDAKALAGVSFVASEGEAIGHVGANGSGKSTLLRLIAGAEVPDQGIIRVRSRPTLLGVGNALQGDLSGRQNIYLGCLALGMSRKSALDQIPIIGEWTELGSALDRPLSTYSSGMNARLKFAVATSVSPDILLVDEALSTGDATFVKKAEARMAALIEDAGNVFIVSHSLPMIEEMCGRVIWLSKGEIVADGPTSTVTPKYARWARLWVDGKRQQAEELLRECRAAYSPPLVYFA